MENKAKDADSAARRAAYRPPTQHAKINMFAIRCFRDTGDGDYIAARLAMRARLHTQYLWAAEQAVEKYLKCILVLNRVNTKDLSHDLERALARVHQTLALELELTDLERSAFNSLVRWNADRYLINSYVIEEHELGALDLLVWRLRQYCEPLDVTHYADEPSNDLLRANLEKVAARPIAMPKLGHLEGGQLERILADRKNPARPGLVWRNLRFSTAHRKRVPMSAGWRCVNSPLYLAQEGKEARVIAEVGRLMRL